MSFIRKGFVAAAAVAAMAASATTAFAQGKTLRVVMHSDLKIIDPIWTTAYIVRNHGYMIYDTLFAQDEKGEIKPQMLDKYDVSADKLTHTFTLRDGLEWHDGQPVTSRGLRRLDQALGRQGCCRPEADELRRLDRQGQRPRPSTIKLKEPTGLVTHRPRQAVVERAVHDAEARRRRRSEQAARRHDRLRPVHLQARRVEARRQDGLRQEHRSTSRALSRPRASPAAKSSTSTASSGARSPTTSRRPTRCSPAKSI